ncbi:MAG: ornithine cyclodeaminase family protein [Chloroflexi bacterium]|nr:ornithine cyclodeaminase family protein [Chloroflexota bacterium]
MEVLIINQQEVTQLLPMNECIEVMAETLAALARGEGIQPLRPVMWLPERVGALGLMPGYLDNINAMGVKVISVFPGNQGTKYDSHQGAVMLFETEHGRLLSLMDATEITAIRTAATTAVATNLLANKEANTLAILGSGVQARTHLEAMLLVRPLQHIRIWSRNPDHAAQFAQRESKRHNIAIETAANVTAAVHKADIVCATTATHEPILTGAMLTSGMHINAVGASVPFARELDTAAVVKSRLFVDRRESALNEAGDFLIPKNEGAIDDNHIIAEIGELLIDQHPGRTAAHEITLFKSLGLAVEDVASAHHIYQQALARGMGTSIELGGGRHDA